MNVYLSLLGLTCDVLCFASLNCEIYLEDVGQINVVPLNTCNYTLLFVNIDCHIYPFVIKLWYLLATDETIFIKNVSLL